MNLREEKKFRKRKNKKHSLSWSARDEVTMHYQNANSHQQTGSVMPLPIPEAVSTTPGELSTESPESTLNLFFSV